MDVLGNEDTQKKILQLIPDEGSLEFKYLDVKRELDAEWKEDSSMSCTEKWESLVKKLAIKEKEKKVFS